MTAAPSRTLSQKLYLCPGEIHPITRAVHLSRLAAFYPKCRDCPLRTDTGQLPARTVQQLQNTERRVRRKSLMTREGIRAVYLNELTRARAGQIAAAFAGMLWEQAPWLPAGTPDSPCRRKARPSVVVGHDERPSSPDIVTGVAGALRQWGCQVIDIGTASTPCFWFAVDHLRASGGIFVTGAGCDPAWTGLNFAGPLGTPLSMPSRGNPECGTATLESAWQHLQLAIPNAQSGIRFPDRGNMSSKEESNPSGHATIVPHAELPIAHSGGLELAVLESRLTRPLARPTRSAGPQRTFRALVPYEAGLWKHFHALRPLTICAAIGSPAVLRTLERLFAELSCRWRVVPIPVRVRRLEDPQDVDIQRVSAGVRAHAAHLGLVIDDDGLRCGFLDERGTLIPTAAVARLIAGVLLAEHPRMPIVAATSRLDELRIQLGTAPEIIDGGETFAAMARSLQACSGALGVGAGGEFWFREPQATCDAILALARMLQALSRSDTPCSRLLSG